MKYLNSNSDETLSAIKQSRDPDSKMATSDFSILPETTLESSREAEKAVELQDLKKQCAETLAEIRRQRVRNQSCEIIFFVSAAIVIFHLLVTYRPQVKVSLPSIVEETCEHDPSELFTFPIQLPDHNGGLDVTKVELSDLLIEPTIVDTDSVDRTQLRLQDPCHFVSIYHFDPVCSVATFDSLPVDPKHTDQNLQAQL